MTIEAELPDGTVLEFPDGTPDSVVQNAVRQQLGLTGVQQPPSVDIDVPTPENLALSAQNLRQREPGIPERILGGLETAVSVAGGAPTEIVAGIAGLAAAANPFAEPGAGARRVEQIRSAGQELFQPPSPSGQAGLQAVGETLAPIVEPVQEFTQAGAQRAAEITEDITGSQVAGGVVGAAFETLPVIASSIVGRFLSGGNKARIQTGNKIQRELQRKSQIEQNAAQRGLSQQQIANLGPDNSVKRAVKQGFDEKIAIVAKNSSPPTRRKIAKMVKIVEDGIKKPLFRQENRPSDVVGDSLVKRFETVNAINKQAGQQLDKVARTLKGKQVDFDPAVRNFINSLADEGVTIGPQFKPVFRNSTFEGSEGATRIINTIMKRISDTKAPDAFDGHRLKRFLDEQISFGKTGQTGLTGRAENIVKGLRRDVDQVLDSNFPAYDRVNTKFSETRTALDAIQDAAGRKIDFTGPNADKASGVALRNLTNNTQKRANLLTALGELEDVAGKFGKQFGDDIATQVLLINEFERMFPNIVGQTGLQGVIGKGIEAVARGRQGVATEGVSALGRGVQKLRGINEENALKSIKELLRGQR